MKRLFQLTMLMFALVLINTGCEKTENVEPIVDPIITVSELIGYWNFVQTEYNDFVYTKCYQVEENIHIGLLSENLYGAIIHELNITPAPIYEGVNFDAECEFTNSCKNNGSGSKMELRLDAIRNRIKIGDDAVYEILEYDKATKILKAKRIEPIYVNYDPTGAIYTWQKQ